MPEKETPVAELVPEIAVFVRFGVGHLDEGCTADGLKWRQLRRFGVVPAASRPISESCPDYVGTATAPAAS